MSVSVLGEKENMVLGRNGYYILIAIHLCITATMILNLKSTQIDERTSKYIPQYPS